MIPERCNCASVTNWEERKKIGQLTLLPNLVHRLLFFQLMYLSTKAITNVERDENKPNLDK
jgi:hypothetical protein